MNAGVLFVNLQHPLGAKLVDCWATAFSTALSDQDSVASAGPWSTRVDDQSLLGQLLYDNRDILDATLVEKGLINYAEGSFIRQALRCAGNSMPLRLQRAADDIRAALSRIPARNPNPAAFAAADDDAGKQFYAFLFEQLRNHPSLCCISARWRMSLRLTKPSFPSWRPRILPRCALGSIIFRRRTAST